MSRRLGWAAHVGHNWLLPSFFSFLFAPSACSASGESVSSSETKEQSFLASVGRSPASQSRYRRSLHPALRERQGTPDDFQVRLMTFSDETGPELVTGRRRAAMPEPV